MGPILGDSFLAIFVIEIMIDSQYKLVGQSIYISAGMFLLQALCIRRGNRVSAGHRHRPKS